MSTELAEHRDIATGELLQPTVFMIAPGSFFSAVTMEPLAGYFRMAGHTSEIIDDFPVREEHATAQDYVNTITRRLKTHHEVGRRVVLLAWSGGSGHVGEALRQMEEEHGSHPVDLVVSISGTLGELPTRHEEDAVIPKQSRNSEIFREGILSRPDSMVEFKPEMALEVFFNAERSMGELILRGSKLEPQYRIDPSPMPEELNTPWLYLHPEKDNVRNLRFVLDAVARYKGGRHEMDWRIVEGGDHTVPITDPGEIWRITMNHLLRRDITITPPIESIKTQGLAPVQRRAMHDTYEQTVL